LPAPKDRCRQFLDYIDFMSGTRLNFRSGLSGRGTRIGSGKRYIEPVVICVWSCDMISRPRDLADRMASRRKPDDGYLRETFTLPRDKARTKARDFLTRYPKAAYMSGVESWRELPGDEIEFTMRRLPSAD
jgi:hypothetical protein